mmetsp:Transcript_5334/g.12227  ORF Transcript_5334/g.12227 Transcript_5334/m.12227 type:complete len:245 (+) Transcript_5334:197-931(+)
MGNSQIGTESRVRTMALGVKRMPNASAAPALSATLSSAWGTVNCCTQRPTFDENSPNGPECPVSQKRTLPSAAEKVASLWPAPSKVTALMAPSCPSSTRHFVAVRTSKMTTRASTVPTAKRCVSWWNVACGNRRTISLSAAVECCISAWRTRGCAGSSVESTTSTARGSAGSIGRGCRLIIATSTRMAVTDRSDRTWHTSCECRDASSPITSTNSEGRIGATERRANSASCMVVPKSCHRQYLV